MCSKHFENRLTNKDFMPKKIILNRDFALAILREVIHEHKLSILATLLT